jgi:hypothetical protein
MLTIKYRKVQTEDLSSLPKWQRVRVVNLVQRAQLAEARRVSSFNDTIRLLKDNKIAGSEYIKEA